MSPVVQVMGLVGAVAFFAGARAASRAGASGGEVSDLEMWWVAFLLVAFHPWPGMMWAAGLIAAWWGYCLLRPVLSWVLARTPGTPRPAPANPEHDHAPGRAGIVFSARRHNTTQKVWCDWCHGFHHIP